MQNRHDEYDEEEEEEAIDIDSIDDEQTLIELLDEAEDFDERKRIRDRLRKVQFEIKAQREEMRKKREEEREAAIRQRLKEAEEQKKRTLAMYDNMAKSAPAGGKKVMDINIYKYNDAGSRPDSPAPGHGSTKRDPVEETIRARLKASEERKKRILAAYDHAAKSQPAGAPRIVEFDAFKSVDVSKLETPPSPVKGSCTFGMAGGIPKVTKASIPPVPKPTTPPDESHLDPVERAIRQRQREADERKRRTLAAYDIVAKSGVAGPKVVVLEEFRDLQITPDMKLGSNYNSAASFRGGVVQKS